MLCPICKNREQNYEREGFCEDCFYTIQDGGDAVVTMIKGLLDRCNALEGLLSKANLTIVETMGGNKNVSLLTKRELADEKLAAQICDGWTGREHHSYNVIRVADEWNLCPDCLEEYNQDMYGQDEYKYEGEA